MSVSAIACWDCDAEIGATPALYLDNAGVRTYFHARCFERWCTRQRFKGRRPVPHELEDVVSTAARALGFDPPSGPSPAPFMVTCGEPEPAAAEQLALLELEQQPQPRSSRKRDAFERVLGRKQRRFGK